MASKIWIAGKAASDETSNPESLPFRVAVDPRAKSLSNSPERQNSFTGGKLDDCDISESPELYFLPLLTFNLVDRRYGDEPPVVDEIVGLMLEPTGTEKGQFRRCGTCRLDDSMVTLFLCDLGNQDLEEAAYKERKPDAIGFDDVVPSNWFGKELDFVPKRFNRFVISVV
ncbi:MAG: hypothetical protein L6R36_000398 [Xanthoria steineri]|nr:MAG: hypothetical protein L6R36_000398 [Xanthoria steineri]